MPPETEAPAAESEAPATPRPFWSGTLTFGLVSVPVNLFPGRRSRRPSLRMLAPDGAPLSRRYFCPIEDRALEPDEIVRGYEHAPGEFVLVTDEELEAVEPEKSRDIDLRVFVPREQLTPFRFGRPYVLTPAGESVKPYRLLASTMERTGRAGIATFVMRGKEYLVAILAANGVLRAETLRFDDELRSPEDVGLPEPGEAPAAEVRRMRDAVKSAERPRPDPRELEDEDGERLRELARRRGRKVEIPAEAAEEEGATKILDLVAVLKRQLEEGGEASAADGGDRDRQGGARKAAARRGAKGVRPRGGGARQKSAARERSGARAAKGRAPGGRGSGALEKCTRDELYRRARELDVPGRSAMSKRELIEALRKRDGG